MLKRTKPCKKCGGQYHIRELSKRGLCSYCGKRAVLDAITQLQTKFGPVYEKWLIHYIASMEATILKLRKELHKND